MKPIPLWLGSVLLLVVTVMVFVIEGYIRIRHAKTWPTRLDWALMALIAVQIGAVIALSLPWGTP